MPLFDLELRRSELLIVEDDDGVVTLETTDELELALRLDIFDGAFWTSETFDPNCIVDDCSSKDLEFRFCSSKELVSGTISSNERLFEVLTLGWSEITLEEDEELKLWRISFDLANNIAFSSKSVFFNHSSPKVMSESQSRGTWVWDSKSNLFQPGFAI